MTEELPNGADGNEEESVDIMKFIAGNVVDADDVVKVLFADGEFILCNESIRYSLSSIGEEYEKGPNPTN